MLRTSPSTLPASERESLESWLEFHRATLLLKCDGRHCCIKPLQSYVAGKFAVGRCIGGGGGGGGVPTAGFGIPGRLGEPSEGSHRRICRRRLLRSLNATVPADVVQAAVMPEGDAAAGAMMSVRTR